MSATVISAVVIIVVVTLLLVVALLVVKDAITPKGTVKIDINNGKKVLDVNPGNSLMATLANEKIFLPSACGGKANCGQCKVQVFEGGGEILPTEVGFFNRKQIKDGWRLGCQVKVKDSLKIQVAESALSVKKLECEVISNKNVATFIKEFVVKLPEGEHLEFKSGEYIQIDIPEYHLSFKDIQVEPEYRKDWDRYGFFNLEANNPEPTVRAYSMASYPGEKGIIKLNVRIATPPFDRSVPKEQGPKLLPVNPGVGSTYVFTRKPGDKVMISGPYGEFLLPENDPENIEYIFVGGGAGMAPLRSHIMQLFKTLGGLLSRRLRRAREGVPELQVPPRSRPSRPRSRCGGRQVHSGLRAQRDVRDISQESRHSRGHQVLHVRPSYDGGLREQSARFSRSSHGEHPLRQLRRIVTPQHTLQGKTVISAVFLFCSDSDPGIRPAGFRV